MPTDRAKPRPLPPDDPKYLDLGDGLNKQFGRGYSVTFLCFFIAIIGTVTVGAVTGWHRLWWISGALFGGMWVFGLVYVSVQGIGVAWGSVKRPGVLRPREHPILYWSLTGVALIVSLAFTTACVWGFANAGAVSAYLKRHPDPLVDLFSR